MKALVLLLILGWNLFGCYPYATDILYHKGRIYSVSRTLLESYFTSEIESPFQAINFYQKVIMGYHPRQYRARWMVQNRRLYLAGIYWGGARVDLKDFLLTQNEQMLFAGWFSGTLTIWQRAKIMDLEIKITIKNGIVVETVNMWE